MMKYVLIAMIGLFPVLSSAATYFYTNTEGDVQSVEASTTQEATSLATDIATGTEVSLDEPSTDTGTSTSDSAATTTPTTTSTAAIPTTTTTPVTTPTASLGSFVTNIYHYVTVEGLVATVMASNPTTAIEIAPNRAPNSGVAIDEGLIEPGTVVPSVAL